MDQDRVNANSVVSTMSALSRSPGHCLLMKRGGRGVTVPSRELASLDLKRVFVAKPASSRVLSQIFRPIPAPIKQPQYRHPVLADPKRHSYTFFKPDDAKAGAQMIVRAASLRRVFEAITEFPDPPQIRKRHVGACDASHHPKNPRCIFLRPNRIFYDPPLHAPDFE
jgi:hypothetical protein